MVSGASIGCRGWRRFIWTRCLSLVYHPLRNGVLLTRTKSCFVHRNFRDIWQEDDCSPEEYQQLLDDDDIYSQVEDEATLEEGAAPALSRFQLDAHVLSSAGKKVDGSSSGSDTSVGATEELSASEGGREEREQREPGLLGSDGLLAVPHVNIVLLLGCVVSVRGETPESWIQRQRYQHPRESKTSYKTQDRLPPPLYFDLPKHVGARMSKRVVAVSGPCPPVLCIQPSLKLRTWT